jgi:thiol-disulfide isomerase/thioredoxin
MFPKAVMRKISLLLFIFCLLTYAEMNGCRKSGPQKPSAPPGIQTPEKVSTKDSPVSKALGEIISRRSSWNPILEDWYGKAMSDFTVKDIEGKTHSLADYRGKNVVVVMWATWCRPCLEEIPHLIALRDIMPADKLAILAISNESVEVVKAMAQSSSINYTVVSHKGVLPEPFSSIRGYPSAFFMKPDGTLKLVTEGALYLGEMKAIILAE